MAVQKVKEIGVRKVLGALARQIFWLFSAEYLPLIGIAFLIAAPVAHYFMQQWLNDFAYNIPLHLGYYLLALAISVGIALFSASYKPFRPALTNPVKALKNE